MDLHLQTTTEQLRTALADALYTAGISEDQPEQVIEDAIQDALDAIARLAIAQLRPRTLERDILAALDRAHAPLAGMVIHNRATGRQSTAADLAATADIMEHLLHIGYAETKVAFRMSNGHPTGQPTTAYAITDQGRSALRA